jgi:hypothetical protein
MEEMEIMRNADPVKKIAELKAEAESLIDDLRKKEDMLHAAYRAFHNMEKHHKNCITWKNVKNCITWKSNITKNCITWKNITKYCITWKNIIEIGMLELEVHELRDYLRFK